MKKFLTSLSSKFSSLIRRNGFLKIISVILAVFAWFAIIYYANPTNSAEFRTETFTGTSYIPAEAIESKFSVAEISSAFKTRSAVLPP